MWHRYLVLVQKMSKYRGMQCISPIHNLSLKQRNIWNDYRLSYLRVLALIKTLSQNVSFNKNQTGPKIEQDKISNWYDYMINFGWVVQIVQNNKTPTIFNIIRFVAGSIVSSTKHLMVQVLFWYIENETVGCWLGLRALKSLYFYFCKLIKKNWKDFCKELCKKLWKKG